MITLLVNNKILYEISKLLPKEIEIIKNTDTLKTQNNNIIISDSSANIPLIKKELPENSKSAIIFVQGITSFQEEYNIQKLEFLARIINQIHTKEGINPSITYLPIDEKTYQDKFNIESNIRSLPEETLDVIVSFIERLSLGQKLDASNIIISTSEIIDNIIEAAIHLNKSSTRIDVELTLRDNVLGITIRDYLGIAEIFSISKSLEREAENKPIDWLVNEIGEVIDQITLRGRGYTLIKKTSDYVITKIVSINHFRKYKEASPHTETSIIYFLDDRSLSEKNKLGIVIEFF